MFASHVKVGDSKTWKVVMGPPLHPVQAPEESPEEPPMAAAIAELMEGPREFITWTEAESVSGEIMEQDRETPAIVKALNW